MLALASRSPRRSALLARHGVEFRVLDVDVAEERRPREASPEYVRRVARDKAAAGLQALSSGVAGPVLGPDTEEVLGDTVFGKPRDGADAAAMLRRLSGCTHQVLSAVWVVSAGQEVDALSVSEVAFAELDDAAIAAYVATGEWEGKAGAYAIQGRAEAFVTRLSGSHSGVMGLPLHETARLLAGFGLGPLAGGAA